MIGKEVTKVEVIGVAGLGNSEEGQSGPTKALGKDEFLKLLTIQLENQDPLEPVNSKEMLAQLAQFSSLEQLENINANLESSINLDLILTQVLSNTTAAGLIGRMIVAEGDQITVGDSDSVPIHFDLGSDADHVVVTVHDGSGGVVRTLEAESLEAGRNQIDWDGTGTFGSKVAEGTYTFKVQAFDAEDTEIDVTTLVVGRIDKAKFHEGEAIVIVAGLEVPISGIREIYEEDSNT